MKKYFPFISFILILSFVLPFFPCFSVLTKAEDTVSSDDAYIKWEKDNVDAIRNGLAQKGYVVNNDYYDNGYYYTDPDSSLWKDILRQWGLDGTDYGKPLSRVVYDYAVSNNISNSDIYNNCFNDIYNNVVSYCPYNTYTVLHKSDLINMLSPTDNTGSIWLSNLNINAQDSNYCYWFGWDSGLLTNGGNNGFRIMVMPLDFFEDYSFYFLDSDIPTQFFDSSNFFFNRTPNSYNSSTDICFPLWCVSSNGIPNSLTFSNGWYSGANTGIALYDHNWDWTFSGSFNLTTQNVIGVFQLPSYYLYVSDWWGTAYSVLGSFFLVPDSVPKFSFMIFKDYNSYFSFSSGNSFVYQFNPDLDLTKYGSDINLDELYDVISGSIGDAEGNIIDTINSVANGYLKDQVELLGDIKNALNDSFGRSWLRKIHDQLDLYFPQTIDKLDNLADSLSNISGGGSGGVADLSNIEDDLSTIKGLLILQTAHDIIDDLKNNNVHSNDFNDVVTVANTKFPFSIPNDIVIILGLFVAEPSVPEFAFPVPFSHNHETFDIDISFIGSSLPYIRGAFIILFILFLVVVSVKVINSLKE